MKFSLLIRLFSIIVFSFSLGFSQIKISNPKANDVYTPDDLIEITWQETKIVGLLYIDYSFDNKNWEKIENVDAKEGSYFWSMPFSKKKSENKDGSLYIRLKKTFDQDIVKISIPSLASHGTVVFTNSNTSINNLIDVAINEFQNNIKIGEKVSIPVDDYSFSAKVKEYGEGSGVFKISGGTTITKKVSIQKTWGSVTFLTKEATNAVINTVPFSYKGKISKYINDKISINLKKGDYELIAEKSGFKELVKKFSIDPSVKNGDVTLTLDWIPTSGKVRFLSNVEDFKIFNSRGKTVTKVNDDYYILEIGTQEVYLRKDGYRSTIKTIDVDPLKKMNEFKISFSPEFGALSIESFPPGMNIYVDSKALNKTTPFTIDSISVGDHEIVLKMDEYRDSKKNIYVEDNLLAKVFVEAEKAMGYLYVNKKSKNQNILFSINGQEMSNYSKSNSKLIGPVPIDIGKNKIRITEYGYRDIVIELEAYDNNRDTVNADGEQIFTTLGFNTKQNDTRLSLKSNQKDPDLDLTIGDNQKLNLPYGKYFLIANAPKYERKKIKFDIGQEGDQFVNVSLEKKNQKDALKWSIIPGGGLYYSEKKNFAYGLFCGVIGAGSLFVVKNSEYNTELDKLNQYEQDYLNQTEIEQISAAKSKRDNQLTKVNNIATLKDVSLMSAIAIYGINFGITWKFNGL